MPKKKIKIKKTSQLNTTTYTILYNKKKIYYIPIIQTSTSPPHTPPHTYLALLLVMVHITQTDHVPVPESTQQLALPLHVLLSIRDAAEGLTLHNLDGTALQSVLVKALLHLAVAALPKLVPHDIPTHKL